MEGRSARGGRGTPSGGRGWGGNRTNVHYHNSQNNNPPNQSSSRGRGGRTGQRPPQQQTTKLDWPKTNDYPLVDIGINLSHHQFDVDRNEVMNRATLQNVHTLICTGTSEKHSIESANLASKFPGIIYSTAGVHPHDAKHWNNNTDKVLRSLLQRKEVVSVGECGLDFDRNFSEKSVQLTVFENQIKLAIELQKPLFLHERKAFVDFLQILDKYASHHLKVCVHCFTGNETELLEYLKRDYYIGITGWICDERRGLELQKIVHHIPINRIMIETDAPFLIPRDKNQYHPHLKAISRNEPYFLPLVLNKLAQCMGTTPEALAHASTQNSNSFFNLK